MDWDDVTQDSHKTILEDCTRLYVAAHENAQVVPQCKFDWDELNRLLTFSPDASARGCYNRYKKEDDKARELLKVRVWPKNGKRKIVLFINKSIRRDPPNRRTIDGKAVAKGHDWILSIGCEKSANVEDLYPTIKEECGRFCREELADKEKLLYFKGILNSPVDRIIEKLDYDGHFEKHDDKYEMPHHHSHYFPWWEWGTSIGGSPNRQIFFRVFKFAK